MIEVKNKEFKATILLLLAAIIWGFAFVAQRVGVQYVESFTFNGVRFALGALSLVPLILLNGHKTKKTQVFKTRDINKANSVIGTIKAGIYAGFMLFMGASLQQIGLVETTAGKAAFITGFYIILVPFFGVFLKQKISKNTWSAAILAITGLYFISINEDFTISRGDLLQLLGSFFWAGHILVISKYSKKIDSLKLSLVQYIVCSLLSLTVAFAFEDISLSDLYRALIPILYGGLASVGIAYTLQTYGQKYAKPAHAAIILSLETVFAAIGGFLILDETMNARTFIGCVLMFAGVLVSQIEGIWDKAARTQKQEVNPSLIERTK